MNDSQTISSLQNICVYCGSGPGKHPAFLQTAHAFGRILAQSRIGLVYGGGSLGLMGEVARATLAAGGRVIGIIPEFLVQREQMLTDVQEVVVTQNMHERKMSMFEKSDGFVALPGGIGTLEELVEVSTWAQLNQHRKPIIIANIENYWEPLLALVRHMRSEKFIRPGLEVKYEVVSQASDIVPAFLKRVQAPTAVEAAEVHAVRSHV